MNRATREIIRLALANDSSVPPDVSDAICRFLDGAAWAEICIWNENQIDV